MLNPRKGHVIMRTQLKYQSSSSHCSKVIYEMIGRTKLICPRYRRSVGIFYHCNCTCIFVQKMNFLDHTVISFPSLITQRKYMYAERNFFSDANNESYPEIIPMHVDDKYSITKSSHDRRVRMNLFH